jgi:hypothetical protein
MESSYGIGVKNRYAVFIGDEEEDPLEIVSKSEVQVKTSADKSTARAVKALNDSRLSNANHQNIIKDNKSPKDPLISMSSLSHPFNAVFTDCLHLSYERQSRRQRKVRRLCPKVKTSLKV